jgi:hypothetical protein
MRIEADRLGEIQEFHDVDPALATFDSCHKRLITPEPRGDDGLSQAGFFALFDKKRPRCLMPGRLEGSRHLPARSTALHDTQSRVSPFAESAEANFLKTAGLIFLDGFTEGGAGYCFQRSPP